LAGRDCICHLRTRRAVVHVPPIWGLKAAANYGTHYGPSPRTSSPAGSLLLYPMALSSSATAHAMDAMATEITSHVANPYPNKVIHADIRIQSIDDESGPSGPAIQSDERLGESKPSIADVVYQEKAADMRECWSKAIAKNMDLPEGYSSAAVLIIRWADALDDLKTGVEVCCTRKTRWAHVV